MPTSDTSEAGLERQIVADMTGLPVAQIGIHPRQTGEWSAPYLGAGYVQGDPRDYNQEYGLDLAKMVDFLLVTQPKIVEQFQLQSDTPVRRKFLARLRDEVSKRGVIDVLRKGFNRGPAFIELFYGTPSPENQKAQELYDANVFSVSRQLHYSRDDNQRSLDLCIFINGLPLVTFELKNNFTKQTVEDAIHQYKNDRNPRDLLLQFGRCAVHFAVDDQEAWMCTHLQGKKSWFLPFNKGYKDGKGNPPNPDGLKTEYLWKEVLARDSLTNIIENYAQIVEKEDRRTGKKKSYKSSPVTINWMWFVIC